MGKDGGIGALLFLLVFSLAITGFGGYMFYASSEQVLTHKPVEATVVSSQMTERYDSDYGTYYTVNVTYEYTVNGETYRSSRVFPGQITGTDIHWVGFNRRLNKPKAERIVVNHPVGAQTVAYYDPNNPSEAFLIRKLQFWPLFPLGIGVFFLLGTCLPYLAPSLTE